MCPTQHLEHTHCNKESDSIFLMFADSFQAPSRSLFLQPPIGASSSDRLGAFSFGTSWKFKPSKPHPAPAPQPLPHHHHKTPSNLPPALSSYFQICWEPSLMSSETQDVSHKSLLPSWYVYDVNNLNTEAKHRIGGRARFQPFLRVTPTGEVTTTH